MRSKSTMSSMATLRQLLHKLEEKQRHEGTVERSYWDYHLLPQMWFLTEHGNPGRPWPIDFVGNMSFIKDDLFHILRRFLWNGTMSEEDARREFESHYLRG